MTEQTPPALSSGLPPLPLILRANPARYRWQSGSMAAIGALAMLGYTRLIHAWPLLLASLVLWLLAAALAWMSCRHMGVLIDEAGFRSFGTLRGEGPLTAWRHIEDIGLMHIHPMTYVRYQFTDDAPRKKVPGGLILPFTHYVDMSIEGVAAIMETARTTFSK
jgi:hypothetical protein